jgi:hypothetical protein
VDVTLLRALSAAARAFADEIERGVPPAAALGAGLPAAGSPASMLEVLRSVAAINDDQGRGANDADVRAIARRAGIDPRGMAGYYAAHLLEKRADGTRWVSDAGRERLEAVSRAVLLEAAPST